MGLEGASRGAVMGALEEATRGVVMGTFWVGRLRVGASLKWL